MATHNKDTLSLIYDNRHKDYVVKYPRKCDGALLLYKIVNDNLIWRFPTKGISLPTNYEVYNLLDDLDKRGYDLTTLKFSIKLKND